MKGYCIFEQCYLRRYRETGIEENQLRLGFIDFLREVTNGATDLKRLSKFCVEGIDDVLFHTEAKERRNVARAFHRDLARAAQDLERKLIDVQIVCKGKLVKGDDWWLEYRQEKLPINVIFGDLLKQEDAQGNEYYLASFNLTSG